MFAFVRYVSIHLENLCNRGASDEKRTLEQRKHRRKATIANATALRALTAIEAVQMRLMKLDLFFVAKRLAFLPDDNRLTWFCRDKEVRREERSDVRGTIAECDTRKAGRPQSF
jgi:ParB family chromosome partitioning protein